MTDRVPAEAVIPLREEALEVARRTVAGDTVRVDKKVRTRTATVAEPVMEEEIVVERVPVGRYVDAAPAVREDGDTLVIPLLEEVLVVERRLMLREEVRVRRTRKTSVHRQEVTLRSEEADVTRTPGSPDFRAPQPTEQEQDS